MGVWAGDDSPSKRDRQPLFLPTVLLGVSEAVTTLKRDNKKGVVPASLTPAGSDCALSRQLLSVLTNPNQVDSLLHELDYYN